MANKRDMRRQDLGESSSYTWPKLCLQPWLIAQVVPYVAPQKKASEGGDLSSMMASSLPMAAVSRPVHFSA